MTHRKKITLAAVVCLSMGFAACAPSSSDSGQESDGAAEQAAGERSETDEPDRTAGEESETDEAEPVRNATAYTYDVPNDPHIAVTGTRIDLGESAARVIVREIGDTRAVTVRTDDGALPEDGISYVYTPLQIEVVDPLQGLLRVGEILTIRHIGGEADGIETVLSGVPLVEEGFQVGSEHVFFLNRAVDVGDGVPAQTPNFFFPVADDAITWDDPETGTEQQMSLNELHQLARTANPDAAADN